MMIRIFLSMVCMMHATLANFDIAVQAKGAEAMPLAIFYVDQMQQEAQIFPVATVAKDLLFLEQFTVSVKKIEKLLSKKERHDLCKQGVCIALFIMDNSHDVDLYVHDLVSDQTIVSKRIKKSEEIQNIAHRISDIVVQALTGRPGIFSTRIAYCKEVVAQSPKSIARKQIIVADVDGSNQHVVLKKPSLVFGLRWGGFGNSPLLFYSEHTKINIRLMMVDMYGHKKIASNEDGITMLPACMPGGEGIVYSATDSNGYAQLYYYGLDKTVPITHNNGNNIAPSITKDGVTIYFCSDYPDDQPHICAYDFTTQKTSTITTEGYCVSPAVSPVGNKLAYIRMVKGIMQIYLYTSDTEKHTQLTFDDENKESISWSPCGTYLLYGSSNSKGDQRIVLFNTITHKKKYLTPASERCSCPAWSPIYPTFPVLPG